MAQDQDLKGWSRLESLFAAYRSACPDPRDSPDFVPRVWAAIESSRPVSWIFPLRLWAQRLALGASLAAALLIGYVTVLQQAPANLDLLEAGQMDALTVESLDEQDAAFWQLASMAENNR